MVEAGRGNLEHEFLSFNKESFLNVAFLTGVIKFGDYKLKLHETYPEAPLSPIYFDLRLVRRLLDVKNSCINVYLDTLSSLDFELLCDIPTAVTPIVSSISDILKIGMITPRMDSKSYGTRAKIDGLLSHDRTKVAVLIDDVLTTAGSKLEALEVLKLNEITVKDIVVLIDREQGGKKRLEDMGYRVHAAFTTTQILDFYLLSNFISKETHDYTTQRFLELNTFTENTKFST